MVGHSPEQRCKRRHRRRTLGWLRGHHVQDFAVCLRPKGQVPEDLILYPTPHIVNRLP